MVYFQGYEILSSLIGGVLIGLAATLNLMILGKISGCSGTINNWLTLNILKDNNRWKIGFVTGFVFFPYLMYKWLPSIMIGDFTLYFFDPVDLYNANLSMFGFALGGFCLGAGAKLGNGCTSGHGVCGLARLSGRSLVFIIVFMASAAICATVRNNYQIFWDTFVFS